MRAKLQKEVQAGRLQFTGQDAFDSAVEQHTQKNVDALICPKVCLWWCSKG